MSKRNISRRHLAIDILDKLVAFDTTSKNSNLDLIHYVRDYLAQHDIETILLHDETGRKANLLATIGPKDASGIVLSGHTDVVPALEEGWKSPAFAMTERDGKLFGRGVADMKGFAACALAMAPEISPFHSIYACLTTRKSAVSALDPWSSIWRNSIIHRALP